MNGSSTSWFAATILALAAESLLWPGAALAQSGPPSALLFDGNGDSVGMGRASALNLPVFTLECRLKRLGAGTAVSSGPAGVTGIPLICKGRAEPVADPRDSNYFFVIRSSDGVLAADFNDTSSGANHPVAGTTPISSDVWHHAAATYDGTTWRLYLNGLLDAELAINATPRSGSLRHFSLGTAMNSAGIPGGMFNGVLDEVRVWNYARSQAQIQSAMTSEVQQATGLVARWGLNEGSGSYAIDTAGAGILGTIRGATWTSGAGFPPSLRTATLTASAVTESGATLNGFLSDLGGAATAQVFFRWGTAPASLTRSTAPQTLSSAGLYQRTLSGFATDTTGYYRAVATTTSGGTVEGVTLSFLATRNCGVELNGSSDYVSMGQAPSLGLAAFTLECWFKPTGAGQATDTGADGIVAVPLLTKGRDEVDGGYRDVNYFLGLRSPGGVLTADFEEAGSGKNHPITGSTPVTQGDWHHAAATYDGASWRLYLDGALEAEVLVTVTPQFNSLHHFALGTALNTNGVPDGFFAGAMDEVRIWDYARSRQQILETLNQAVPAAPGLRARWSFSEGLGTIAADSSGNDLVGFIAAGRWAPGAPFDINVAPDPPMPVTPTPGGLAAPGDVQLTVRVVDPDADPLDVAFFGRTFTGPAAAPFTIVALPDTQYYSQSDRDTFVAQTRWILDHRAEMNIVYVAHLGDIVNVANQRYQWENANAALSLLDSMPDLALGLCVGNHDQTPNGEPAGTESFNEWFPSTRYENRPWYGGYYGPNYDNHYVLFSAGGMDFIGIHLEYDTTPSTAVLNWAGALLDTHSARRGIVSAHSLMNVAASWTAQGSATYNALKSHPNLFLMLCGHISGESRRTEVSAGTVHGLLADYQSRSNGGNGWLRILQFVPADNAINVRTYSPTLNQYETDSDSEFTLAYNMGGVPFAPLGTVSGAASGTDVSLSWTGLELNRAYEWYAIASDGGKVSGSPWWSFTTARPALDLDGNGDVDFNDFGLFAPCAGGPNAPYNPLSLPSGCTLVPDADGRIAADADKDGDVDQSDFGALQRCYHVGPLAADPNCASGE